MNLWRRISGVLLAGVVAAAPARALERLEPSSGCYIGMLIGDADNIPSLSSRLGLTPAVYTRFYAFPFSSGTRQNVNAFLDEVRANGGIAALTLEPFSGLGAVTVAHCDDLAALCASQEALGIGGIMIRFAHEMNGNWYAWGQQPTLYRQTFQLLAASVHAHTTRTAMLWSPNNGIGYPFGTGTFSPAPGSANFLELDTNHDNVLTQADDMFGPFYPGDGAVDWVSLTLYHWGVTYPWGENEPPYPGEFASVINATGPGSPADYSRWYYARYCEDGAHNKPLAITETAAFYNVEQPGGNEVAMKKAWFRQIYNISGASADGPDVAATFPKLKCINWFDHCKREGEAQNRFVDWRASANPLVRSAFVAALQTLRGGEPYFLTAQEFNFRQSANGVAAVSLPAIVPLSGNISARLKVKAQAACDLEVDLLDQGFGFKGGTRVPVTAGDSTIQASFQLASPLVDGQTCRWSIFLTPTGGTYQNALAWYRGPDPVARAVAPTLAIDAAPPSIAPNSAFSVRVRYTAAADSVVQVSLRNSTGAVRGSGATPVSRGDGLLDVTVTQQAGNSAGAYHLQPVLFDSPLPPQTLVAQGTDVALAIAAAPAANLVALTPEPAVVLVGEVFRFAVGYATAGARDLRIEITDASSAVVASAVQPVAAGSGTRDMTCAPLLAAGSYGVRLYLVPTGGSPAQAVASTPSTAVYVVSEDYESWVRSRWGVIFGSDPIAPVLDPDGDSAPNRDEYVALTDPRNSGSRFRMHAIRSGSQLILRWPTVVGRTYQLFHRAAWSTGTWIPASSVQAGTGATLEIQTDLGASGPEHFYRVQVALP